MHAYISFTPSNKQGLKNGRLGSACNAGDLGSVLGREDSLEKGMATYSSILAWRSP